MTQNEPEPALRLVDFKEYERNIPNRIPVTEMLDPNEIYTFYSRISKMSEIALHAYASVEVETLETDAVQTPAFINLRDADFSPISSNHKFRVPGSFQSNFFVISRSTNLTLNIQGEVRSVGMGFLVRDNEGYSDELLEDMASPSLDRYLESARS